MKRFSKVGASLAILAAMAMPALSQGASVEGTWRPDKDSDYLASMCGKDNMQLCIKVAALRGGMNTEKNRPYLNTMIIDHAKPSGKSRWKGKITLFGITGDATVTLRSASLLHIKACAYLVICREIELKR